MGRNRSVKWFVLVGLCVLLCSTGVLAYERMGRMKSPEDEQETTSENPTEGEASTDMKTPVTGEDFFQLGEKCEETAKETDDTNKTKENLNNAVKYYHQAAELGYAPAMCSLGLYYLYDYDLSKRERDLNAIKWFFKAAKLGNIRALEILISLRKSDYYFDCGLKKNEAKIFQYCRKAAEQGNTDAMCLLGDCCLAGIGVEKNNAEAIQWYRKAAELGNVEAQFNLGTFYEIGIHVEEDMAEAVKWYRKAAEQGDEYTQVEAQIALGDCYYDGDGVEENRAEAIRWWRKAKEQKFHDLAPFYLDECDGKNEDVEANLSEKAREYLQAAKQGDVEAQVALAECYEKGDGTEKNISKAIRWYRKAAMRGNAKAQCCLGAYYFVSWIGEDRIDGFGDSTSKAAKWYHKAAKQGNVPAMVGLAEIYGDNHCGIKKDLTEAVKWYRKAAEKGNADAMYLLAELCEREFTEHCDEVGANYPQWYCIPVAIFYLYRLEEKHREDLIEAAQWYRKAAELGDTQAMCRLAEFYAFGLGVKMDLTEAARWLRKAAELGDAEAQFLLGEFYAKGLGVEKDLTEAVKWYQKSTDHEHTDTEEALEPLEN